MGKRATVLAAAVGMLVLGATGCSWVALTPEGETVRIGSATETSACERLGKTNAKTSARIVFARSDDKIREELEALARNEAAAMGGNAVVPVGVPEDGRQTYEVYRCP